MTIATPGLDRIIVGTVGLMTGDAGGGGSAVLVIRFMAAGTFQPIVFADKREVGRLVSEFCFVKRNDICVAAFMVGVAE